MLRGHSTQSAEMLPGVQIQFPSSNRVPKFCRIRYSRAQKTAAPLASRAVMFKFIAVPHAAEVVVCPG